MTDEIIVKIVECAFTIGWLVLVYFLVPFIRGKLTQQQLETLKHWAEIAVKAVEQKSKGSDIKGFQKKEEVVQFLISNGILEDTDLNDEQDNIIESAVFDINR